VETKIVIINKRGPENRRETTRENTREGKGMR
jgi:hypothetical protein